MIGSITNHLWQSTAFALAVTLLTLLFRGHRAPVRYGLWFSASVKFCLPLSLLISLGSQFDWASTTQRLAPSVAATVVQISQPFAEDSLSTWTAVPAAPAHDWSFALIALWVSGFGAIVLARLRSWRRINAAVRASVPVVLSAGVVPPHVRVRAIAGLHEPGVVGFARPTLLLPSDITRHLTPAQLQAVLTHELCHIRRRDNLTAGVHMVVEAVFWFHPLIWWIGARLVEERERACDEAVLTTLTEPIAYAEGILNVCKHYVEAPLACMSGVSGASLRKRVEAIMANRVGRRLTASGRLLLVVAGLFALALPIGVGTLMPSRLAAQSPANRPSFEVASVKENRSGALAGTVAPPPQNGQYRATNISLDVLIGVAYQPLQRYELQDLPDWARTTHFDIDAKAETSVPPAQIWLMLQSLLANRFKFAAHREPRPLPVYALVALKPGQTGPGLRRHMDDSGCVDPASAPPNNPLGLDPAKPLPQPACGGVIGAPAIGRLAGQKLPLDTLGRAISGQFGRPVLDLSGFSGDYDWKLEWIPEQVPSGANASAVAAATNQGLPSIFTAVQEQLGLKLVPQTAPVSVLIVDHIERPSED